MSWRKKLVWMIVSLLLIVLGVVVWFAWRAFPIISGYGAKNMASAVFVQRRLPADILKEDLGSLPLSLGTYTVNEEDSSVTGSVWGLARRKAIYRPGLGCTLVSEFSEQEIRSQPYTLAPAAHPNSDTLPWPYGNQLTEDIPPAVDTAVLRRAIDHAMGAASGRKPAYTRAVVVVYDGRIVGERYAPGFNQNTVMLGWSVSKSLTGALIGVLVQEGRLDPDAPAPVPEWKGSDKEKITVRHLLQQTSGLDFEEAYAKPSGVTNMLFRRGDMAAFTTQLPLKYAPGTVFNYSSGNTNVLSRIIRQVVGEKDYVAFPYRSLFHKLNMYSLLLEPDASGTFIGSSYSYATARDFARFGLLYYNHGVWNGQQVLPAGWVEASIRPSEADKRQHYGYQFWLNGLSEEDPTKRMYPDVPADLYFANGYGGQNIYVIPSKKLVVVRNGLHELDGNKFLKEVIQAIRE
jgi:CubicO group peptidase (beta-lactamase class C family)